MPSTKYKLVDPERALVDDIELVRGGGSQTLTQDQVQRLEAVGVNLEPDSKES